MDKIGHYFQKHEKPPTDFSSPKSQHETTKLISHILGQLLKIGNYFHQIQKHQTIQQFDINLEQELIKNLGYNPCKLMFGGHKELRYHSHYYNNLSKHVNEHLDLVDSSQNDNLNHDQILKLLGIASTYDSMYGKKQLISLTKKLNHILESIDNKPEFQDTSHKTLVEHLSPTGTKLEDVFINRSTTDSYIMCLGFSQLINSLHNKYQLRGYIEPLLSQLTEALLQLKNSPYQLDHSIDNKTLLDVFPVYIYMLDTIYSDKFTTKIDVPSYWKIEHQNLLEKLFLCRHEYPNNQGLVFGRSQQETQIHMNIYQEEGEPTGIESLPLPGSVHIVNGLLNKALLQSCAEDTGMKKTDLHNFCNLVLLYTGTFYYDEINLSQSSHNFVSYQDNIENRNICKIKAMHEKQILNPFNKTSIASKFKSLFLTQDPEINFIYHPATGTDLEGKYGRKNESLDSSVVKSFLNFIPDMSNDNFLENNFIITDTGYCLETAFLMQRHQKTKGKKIPLVISAQLALQNPDKLLPWRKKKTSKEKRAEDTTSSLIKLLEMLHYYPFQSLNKHHSSLILHGSSGATLSYNLNDQEITKEAVGQFGNPNFPSRNGVYTSTFSLSKDFLRKNQ